MNFHSVASRILLLVALFLLVGFSVVVTMNALQSSAAAKEAALHEVRSEAELEVQKLAQFLYGSTGRITARWRCLPRWVRCRARTWCPVRASLPANRCALPCGVIRR